MHFQDDIVHLFFLYKAKAKKKIVKFVFCLQALLIKIRELLWTMSSSELSALEKCLCSMEEPSLSNKNTIEPEEPCIPASAYGPAAYTSEFVQKFYANYPSCESFTPELSTLYSVGKKSDRYDRKRDRASKISRSSRVRQARLNEKCLARLTDGEERPKAHRKRRRSNHSHRHHYNSSSSGGGISNNTNSITNSHSHISHSSSQNFYNSTSNTIIHSNVNANMTAGGSHDSDSDKDERHRRHRQRQSGSRNERRHHHKSIREIVCSCGSNNPAEPCYHNSRHKSSHSSSHHNPTEFNIPIHSEDLHGHEEESSVNTRSSDVSHTPAYTYSMSSMPPIEEITPPQTTVVSLPPTITSPVDDLPRDLSQLSLETCHNCSQTQGYCYCNPARTSSPDYFADHSLTENTPPTSPHTNKLNPSTNKNKSSNSLSNKETHKKDTSHSDISPVQSNENITSSNGSLNNCSSTVISDQDACTSLIQQCSESRAQIDEEENLTTQDFNQPEEISSVVASRQAHSYIDNKGIENESASKFRDESGEEASAAAVGILIQESSQREKLNDTEKQFINNESLPEASGGVSVRKLDGCSSGSTSPHHSGTEDDEEVALALQAAEVAATWRARARFTDPQDLIHRLFVCISGVADQLQTNYPSDLRKILKWVFLVNQTPAEEDPLPEEEEKKDKGLISTASRDHSSDSEQLSVESAEDALTGIPDTPDHQHGDLITLNTDDQSSISDDVLILSCGHDDVQRLAHIDNDDDIINDRDGRNSEDLVNNDDHVPPSVTVPPSIFYDHALMQFSEVAPVSI